MMTKTHDYPGEFAVLPLGRRRSIKPARMTIRIAFNHRRYSSGNVQYHPPLTKHYRHIADLIITVMVINMTATVAMDTKTTVRLLAREIKHCTSLR